MTYKTRPAHQGENDLLTETEAREEELPMSLAWFRRKRVCGGGPPFIRISNRVFYRRAELRQWVAAQATPPMVVGEDPVCTAAGEGD